MQNFKRQLFLFFKSFCRIKLNKSARRVWALGHHSPNQPPHLRDDNTAVEGRGGTSLRSQSCGSRAPDFSQAPSCPVTVGPESCSHLSPANLAARCLHTGPAHTTAFIAARRGGLLPNRQVQSWCWDSPSTSKCRSQQHGTQESDNKALGNSMAPSSSIPPPPAHGKINTN